MRSPPSQRHDESTPTRERDAQTHCARRNRPRPNHEFVTSFDALTTPLLTRWRKTPVALKEIRPFQRGSVLFAATGWPKYTSTSRERSTNHERFTCVDVAVSLEPGHFFRGLDENYD